MNLQSVQIVPGTTQQVWRQIESSAACSPNRALDAHDLTRRSSQAQKRQVTIDVIGEHQIGLDNSLWDYTFEIQHLNTGNFQLIDLQWQETFQLTQTTPADRYLIFLVYSGHLNQTIDLQQTCCSPNIATIVGPSQKLTSSSSQEGQALSIAIDRDSIDNALGKLLDRHLKQPLIFRADIDLASDLGLSLKKFLQFLWDATAGAGAVSASFVLKELELAFVACIIKGLPSNYTEELQYQHEGALAAHVRKAQAFIESHLQEDINLGAIAAAAGVCPRLLQKAFAQECGCSPMRFVTHARLQRIRQELELATSDLKIVDVMMNYGFTQGGKFAKEYQQLFGEKPSDTLKRSIQCHPADAPLWAEIDDARSDRIVGGCHARSSQMVFTFKKSPSKLANILFPLVCFNN